MTAVARLALFISVVFVALAVASVAGGQEGAPVDVIVISGPLDPSAVRYLEDVLEEVAAEGSQAAILQLDSEGALTDDIDRLLDLFAEPPLPLVVWVGEAPAVAHGGAAQLLLVAPLATAAPGVEIGYFTPTVAGREGGVDIVAGTSSFSLFDEVVKVDGPIPDVVDEALPSIGQVVVWLDGQEVASREGVTTLATAEEVTGDDGTLRLSPTVPVRFHEPGLVTRTLRLAIRPEAAFFFLIMGLTLAAFEYYAIGPGLAAVAGVASLLIAGYGLAVLPLRWWALVLIGAAMVVYTVAFQRRSFGLLSVLATGALLTGGLFLTDAAPQMTPSVWGVALTVLVAIFFFVYAMPLTSRARFSTGTIGRGRLIGRAGSAVTALIPEGVVEIDGSRWRARSHREAGITAGDAITVTAVRGLELEVEPRDEA
jgi:membrane-bound ClpP family serine protease